MSESIERARKFATGAHQRIDQRRKYSGQPYHVHLEAVARTVSSVTTDEETICAAWLHDVVEDTPATLEDVEREFGASIAALVEELTDTSRPSDGNRATRKAIDRRHTSHASARAKTVKLADLIDNCEDITRHDPRFARTFLQEMEALLEVLAEGDATLLERARALHRASAERLAARPPSGPVPAPDGFAAVLPQMANPHIVRTFREAFTAGDIVEPLLSFDADKAGDVVARTMKSRQIGIAGIRVEGALQGYVSLANLEGCGAAACGNRMQHITVDQMLDSGAPLIDVVGILARHDHCFVSILDSVVGVIEREAVNKPVVRMWLFGVISLYEMGLVQLIEHSFPNDGWQTVIAPARLEKARALQVERERRNQHSRLIDCLQFSDKAHLMLEQPQVMNALGLSSRRLAKQLVKDLESLRNHLAHAQDIVSHDWIQIIRIAQRVAEMGSP
jgi:hypothetical protein